MGHGLFSMAGDPWQSPHVGFTQAQLQAAGRAVDELSRPDGRPELVLVGGGPASGLGLVNETIDVYAVGGALSGLETVREVDGTPVRVHALSADRVAELVSLSTDFRATTTSSPQLALDCEQIPALIRLVTAHRLTVSPRWAAELDRIDEDTVRQILVTRGALTFAACAADTFRSVLSGDLFTAWTMSAAGLLCGGASVLSAAGEFGTNVNFLFRMLARSCVTVPWFSYLWRLANWSFPADRMPPPAQVRSIIEERLLAANLLIAWCAIEGWDKKLAALPAPPATTGALPKGEPRRSPYFTPVRFADAWTLLGPGQGYLASEEIVRLWRGLDGGNSMRDCVDQLVASESHLDGLTQARAGGIVSALHELGAVEMLAAGDGSPSQEVPIVRTARFDLAARCSWDLRLNR